MDDRRLYIQQVFHTFIFTMTGVWLIVLIMFMVVTPIYAPGVWPLLEPPSARTGQKAPDTERDVWLSVRANGEVFVDEKKVSVPDLAIDASRNVFVRVDRAAPFGAVRALVRAAQRSGRRRLTFMVIAVDPEKFVAPLPLPCNDPDVQPPIVEHRRVMPERRRSR